MDIVEIVTARNPLMVETLQWVGESESSWRKKLKRKRSKEAQRTRT